MRAFIPCTLALGLLVACGESEERNAPPVGSGGGAGPVTAGSGTPTSGGSETDTANADDSGSTGGITMPTAGAESTGPAVYAVVTGRFNDGGGGYPLPIRCQVRFHRPGEINPTNGLENATTFSRVFTIDAFPQPFTISNTEIGDIVMMGDTGFVTTHCDVNGDNLFDDGAGAYFPGLPLTEVSIPASSIDLNVAPF